MLANKTEMQNEEKTTLRSFNSMEFGKGFHLAVKKASNNAASFSEKDEAIGRAQEYVNKMQELVDEARDDLISGI